MPQPQATAAAAQRLIRVYDRSHEQLVDLLAQALADPARHRQVARLRELIRVHEEIMDGLRRATAQWIGATLPELHALGATWAAQAVGSSFVWSQPHLAAVEQLAERTWADIAPRLRGISTETRRQLRVLAQDSTRRSILGHTTAQAAGRDMAREMAREGIWSVTYRNGARHTMRDYADTVIRTTTAQAYNTGSLTQTVSDGIDHIEYLDGAGCGVTSHDDPQEADGLIVPIDQAVMLAHPRCRRSIAPAPFAASLGLDAELGPEPAPSPAVVVTGRRARTPRVAAS